MHEQGCVADFQPPHDSATNNLVALPKMNVPRISIIVLAGILPAIFSLHLCGEEQSSRDVLKVEADKWSEKGRALKEKGDLKAANEAFGHAYDLRKQIDLLPRSDSTLEPNWVMPGDMLRRAHWRIERPESISFKVISEGASVSVLQSQRTIAVRKGSPLQLDVFLYREEESRNGDRFIDVFSPTERGFALNRCAFAYRVADPIPELSKHRSVLSSIIYPGWSEQRITKVEAINGAKGPIYAITFELSDEDKTAFAKWATGADTRGVVPLFDVNSSSNVFIRPASRFRARSETYREPPSRIEYWIESGIGVPIKQIFYDPAGRITCEVDLLEFRYGEALADAAFSVGSEALHANSRTEVENRRSEIMIKAHIGAR